MVIGPDSRRPPMIRIERLDSHQADQETLERLLELARRAFGPKLTDQDWAHALGGRHLIAVEGTTLLAHAAVVERVLEASGRRWRTGYVEAVATDPTRQRQGIGGALMHAVADEIRDRYELGALSTGRPAFYRRSGWETWRGPTWVRRGGRRERTPDEDGGVMVLRFGPSRDLDPTAAICCEERPGDDW